MPAIRPGSDGQSLPNGTLIFRIASDVHLSPEAIRRGTATETMFELSSDDKRSPGQRLSVWVEALTVADQAWAIMGKKPSYTIVACLGVDAIRAIATRPGIAKLDVEWEQAVIEMSDGQLAANLAPGAEGHAGITGLNQGGRGKDHKNQRKELRSRLADVSTISPVPVPHDIPEELIRVAAYYIHQANPGSSESNWIAAIRQLRRACVKRARGEEGSRQSPTRSEGG